MKRRRLLRGLGLLALVFLTGDQALQHLALGSENFMGRRMAPFDPPFYTAEQRTWVEELEEALAADEAALLPYREFDAELGWAPRSNSGEGGLYTTDEFGARVGFEALSPRKSADRLRIVTVGCSFTRGDEVKNLEAWPALLDRERDDFEAANLAMGAYGIDQAWMRLERDGFALQPDEVWLGVMPTALLRCVNVYRPALRHWTATPAWKPRYRLLEDGELTLVPMPLATLGDVLEACQNQERFRSTVQTADGWCSDLWIRRTLSAWQPRGAHWTHHSGFARLIQTWRDGRGREPARWIADSRSEVFRTSLAVARATAEATHRQGANFRIIVLPSREDLAHAAPAQSDYWTTWCDEIRADGIEVFDLSPALRAANVLTDEAAWMAGGHYSPKTNLLIAQVLAQALK